MRPNQRARSAQCVVAHRRFHTAVGACRVQPSLKTTRQAMVKPFPSKTFIGNHALHPETLMLNYGYDPQLSEGAVKPPVFLTSTFVFRTAENGQDFFDFVAGRREPPEGTGRTIHPIRALDTPDEHFIIDHHPTHKQVVLASPCSGHGYKFCSVVGEILTDLATGDGSTRHDIGFLRLARPAFSQMPQTWASVRASQASLRSPPTRKPTFLHWTACH